MYMGRPLAAKIKKRRLRAMIKTIHAMSQSLMCLMAQALLWKRLRALARAERQKSILKQEIMSNLFQVILQWSMRQTLDWRLSQKQLRLCPCTVLYIRHTTLRIPWTQCNSKKSLSLVSPFPRTIQEASRSVSTKFLNSKIYMVMT